MQRRIIMPLMAAVLMIVPLVAQPPGPSGPQLPPAATDADYYDNGAPDPAKVELGQLLFFDKILSGNMNTSCATCHHPLTDLGDGLSLPVGEGARGLGVTRDTGSGLDAVHERVPRNAPHVFNLGAREFTDMFHDGRVTIDPSQPSGFLSPAGSNLPPGLDNVLAVQAMFPVTSATEMAGQLGENLVAKAAFMGNLAGPGGVWEQLADRLRAIPEYQTRFTAVFPGVNGPADITYVHAANAIAAFEAFAWRADDSPFDRYLRGDRRALSTSAKRGMRLFYGSAGCSSCHSGTFQTDQQYYSICMPQIGPGKGDGPTGHEDFGRERVTLQSQDRFRFRTPPLRNVALTGPWGHDGAFNTLEAAVRHHLDPVSSVMTYETAQAVLPSRPDLDAIDFLVMSDPALVAQIVNSGDITPVSLSEGKIKDLMAFLHALTDPRSLDLRHDVPKAVPSGLTLAE